MQQPKPIKPKKQTKQIVNINKSKKNADLSKQFQDFKLRIQQFQNKNEQIISRIRETYTIKKKAIQEIDHLPQRNIINHNHHRQYDGESASSCDYSKNVVYEGNMMKHSHPYSPFYNSNVEEYQTASQQLRNPVTQQPKASKQQVVSTTSMVNPQYEMHRYQSNNENYARNIPNARLNTQQDLIVNRAEYQPKTSGKFGYQSKDYAELQQKYKQQLAKNEELQHILTVKEEEIAKIKNQQIRFKSYTNTLKHVVQEGMQCQYQEEIVSQRFVQLQKYLKKCEQRLKNLSLRLKDAIQEKKSRKNIHRSRSKRNSVSRSKKDQSSLSEQAIDSTPKISRYYPQSKAKNQSENPQKHKQFEQIAADYENMVKAKTAQIQRLQKRLNEEMNMKQFTSNQLQKSKALLLQKQKELSDFKKIKKPVKQQFTQGRQYKQLKEKLTKYEDDIKAKEIKEKQLNQIIQKLEKSKKTLHDQYTENLNKNKIMKNKTIQEMQSKLKDFQASNHKSASQLRQKLNSSQKKLMQKQCELMAILNKLKKVENECLIKEEKLRELQNLLLKQNDHGDLLDKSMSIDTSVISQTQIRHLHENIRRQDQEIQEQKGLIYDMQKEKYILQQKKKEMESSLANLNKVNNSLEIRVAELKKELQNYKEDEQKDLTRELYDKNQLIQQYQADKELLLQEKQELLIKNQELMDQLKKNKENNLATNRQLIKITSELNFTKNQHANIELKFVKSKEQLNSLKSKIEELSQQKKQMERKFENDNANLHEQVQNLKNHILQLQTVGNRNNYEKEQDMLLNSLHVSQISFNYQPNKVSHEEQLSTLKEKVRDLQMALDIKSGMQQQIQNQYKSNLQIIRLDNADKKKQLQKCRQEIQLYKRQIQNIKTAQRQDESFQNYKISMYQDKIVQMEEEYNVLKQSQERLNEMLHQIVQTIKQREDEKEKLLRQLQQKQKIIQQYRQLLQIKQTKFQPHNKTMKSDTMKQFSLRISGDHSEQFADTAELSYLSNISDVFKRDDLLQEKIKRGKTSREEHVKLFAKTSAYIKSLKAIIDTKQKRIKLLEKQLTSIKSQQNKTWSDKQKSEVERRPYYTEEYQDIEQCDQYKDYESVQLDTRRSKYQELIKQLINQKSLAIEENKLLSKQIEALQDQILRSQEQQNSLVRIKDLYKDQIKKLIEKNQVHTKQFEIQINKMKQQLERSQSYHNLQAIKQLFVKIIEVICFLDERTAKKDEKKDEKRKQLQDYVKVMCSILHFDSSSKDKLMASIKK